MKRVKKYRNYIIVILIILYYKSVNCQSFNYGMKYTKAFQLHNGNIMIAGDININTYDKTGMISLYNCSLVETITSDENSFLISFAQFSEKFNGLVIVIVMDVIYIFDYKGSHIFNYKMLSIYLNEIKYYVMLPHIYKDGRYYFILGYRNNSQKLYIQYISFDLDEKILKVEDDYEYNDIVNFGLSCQFMDNEGNEVLTCFNQNNQLQIAANSFRINNNTIEKINLNASYNDRSFIILSEISKDRKKSLLCYIRDVESASERCGCCEIYDIESNSFRNVSKSSSKLEYGTTVNNVFIN